MKFRPTTFFGQWISIFRIMIDKTLFAMITFGLLYVTGVYDARVSPCTLRRSTTKNCDVDPGTFPLCIYKNISEYVLHLGDK